MGGECDTKLRPGDDAAAAGLFTVAEARAHPSLVLGAGGMLDAYAAAGGIPACA